MTVFEKCFLFSVDSQTSVPGLQTNLPRWLHWRVRVKTCCRQEMAELSARHHRPRPLRQRSQCSSRCHGCHSHSAAAAGSRSDRLQVLDILTSRLIEWQGEGGIERMRDGEMLERQIEQKDSKINRKFSQCLFLFYIFLNFVSIGDMEQQGSLNIHHVTLRVPTSVLWGFRCWLSCPLSFSF